MAKYKRCCTFAKVDMLISNLLLKACWIILIFAPCGLFTTFMIARYMGHNSIQRCYYVFLHCSSCYFIHEASQYILSCIILFKFRVPSNLYCIHVFIELTWYIYIICFFFISLLQELLLLSATNSNNSSKFWILIYQNGCFRNIALECPFWQAYYLRKTHYFNN
jgi:hypothetical protein